MTKTRSSSRNKNHNKFSVFDFGRDDERIEKRSKKSLQQFSKPNKFDSSPLDKYSFLSFFSRGSRSSENDSVTEIVQVDDNDDVAEQRMWGSGATVASSNLNLKPSTEYCLDHLESKCDTSGAKCSLTRVKKTGCSITDGNSFSGRVPLIFPDNDPVILDSDDDTKIDSSKTARYLPERQGSGNQQELMQNPNLYDAESLVVVEPDHIFYGDTFYDESSTLTFSCSSIKFEGSPSFGTKLSYTQEWTLSAILCINSLWCKSFETVIVDLHLKSKDAEVAKRRDNEISGTVVLKFTFFDPNWSKTQEAIQRLDVIYKEKWIDNTALDSTRSYNPFREENSISVSKHYYPNSRENFEEFIYPEGDPDAVSISKRDVDLLQPKTFINDTIIDFYIMYLKSKINAEEKDRFHFFNSFFFRKLADLDKDPSRACEGRAAFQRVRRWTAKVNIFGKDFIFIPVNFSLHWSLIVICHPGEVATFREEEMERSSRVPCILHMDSIRGSHKGLKNLIRSYLLEEWKERHKEVAEDVARKFSNLLFVCRKLPQQENSFDCGLFLLHYVEIFLKQAPLNFNPSHITASSKFLAEDWFSAKDVACKREYIKRLICEITKDRVQKVSPADIDDNDSLHCLEEETTSMNFLQETCSEREACHGNDLNSHADELLTVSPVTNLIRDLKSTAVSEEISRDLPLVRDSAKPLTDDNYRHYGQKAPRKLFSNVMSPIEEEATRERTSFSPTMKEGSQHIENISAPHASSSSKSESLFLGRLSRSPDSEETNPGCRSNACGSPNSLEIQDEEYVRAEAEEVSSPDAAKYDSAEDLASYIVLDSQEEDENLDLNGLANNLPTRLTISALCHEEVGSADIYDYKVKEKIPSSQLVVQAAKKPRHVPEVIEVPSSGTGKNQIVSSSTSEEFASCFVQDSEEVDSNICIEVNSFKPSTGSGNEHVAGKMRHLFRRRRRIRS